METFRAHCPTVVDANDLLQTVVTKCQAFLPDWSLDSNDALCAHLVASLGELRSSVAEAFKKSRHHLPSISMADLDRVVCQLPVSAEQLRRWGFVIFQKGVAAARSALPPNVGGRPSKVSDKSLQELVRKTLEAYLKDSERVLVVGRGMNKKMVLAQHLTKKRNAIYNVESALSSAMSRETFRKVMKIHFPHVKNPRRLTDICASCRDQGIILFCFLVPPYFVTMSLQ